HHYPGRNQFVAWTQDPATCCADPRCFLDWSADPVGLTFKSASDLKFSVTQIQEGEISACPAFRYVHADIWECLPQYSLCLPERSRSTASRITARSAETWSTQ